MKKIVCSLFLIFALAAGCLPTITPWVETSPDPWTEIVNTPEPTPTLLKVTPTQMQDVIQPQVSNICPEDRIVPLQDLGLPPNLRLLLLPGDSDRQEYNLSILLPGNKSPELIPTIKMAANYRSVSPNHQWIFFYKSNEDGVPPTLWVSSLNGQEQWPVLQPSQSYFAVWATDQEIFIIYSPIDNGPNMLESYMASISINPFTLEIHTFNIPSHDTTSSLFYYGAVKTNGLASVLYGYLNQANYLYTSDQESAVPIFQWLDNIDHSRLRAFLPIWVYDGDKFAVTVADPNGVDLAMGVDIEAAKRNTPYNSIMKKFLLPQHLLPLNILGTIPNQEQVLFQRYDTLNFTGPSWLYMLDYSNQTITDYCFDLVDSVETAKFSPDGRFVAISLVKFMSLGENEDHSVIVFDLQKGLASYLKGYLMIDWGVITEKQ